MKLALSSKAEREVDAAIKEIAGGKFVAAIERLCAMRGHFAVPEVKVPKRFRTQVVEPPARADDRAKSTAASTADRWRSTPESYAVRDAERPIRPVPKPHRRHVDKDRVAEFRALNPRCCVTTCQQEPADPHHIWPRGRGGSDDSDANLMALCRLHHDEIERIDNEAFRTKYVNRLPDVVLMRMKLAMMMEAEAKLAGRPAVDLDAEGM